MSRFSQYPVATSPTDYTDATNFLIEDPDGNIKLASLDGLSTFFCGAYCASVTIPSAEILTLNSIPVEVIPAQGAGTVIKIIDFVAKMSNVVTPYATNVNFQLTNGGGTYLAGSTSALLSSSVDKIGQYAILENPSVAQTQLIENTAVTATVATGDPTAGDGDMELFVYYRIISV